MNFEKNIGIFAPIELGCKDMSLTRKIRERLSESTAVQELGYVDQKRTYTILKAILERQRRGVEVRPMELREACSGIDESRFFTPAIDWLAERGYIKKVPLSPSGHRRKLEITEEGEQALLILDGLVTSPETKELEMSLNLETKCPVSVKLDSKNLVDIDKLLITLAPEVRDRVLKLLYSLVTQVCASNFEISLSVKNFPIDSKLLELAILMQTAYETMVGRSVPLPLHEKYGEDAVHSWSDEENYSKKWIFYAERAIEGQSKGIPIDRDYLSQFLSRSLLDRVEESNTVRNWIDRKLDEDPDFFMPHIFWIALGFKQRMEPDVPQQVSSPSPEMWITYGKFQEKVLALAGKLDFAYQTLVDKNTPMYFEWSGEEVSYDIMHDMFAEYEWDFDPDFYESWRVLRRTYHSKLPDISRILDEALVLYLLKKRPNVDLAKVFSDLAHKRHDISQVIDMIKKDEYVLGERGQKRYDPLDRTNIIP